MTLRPNPAPRNGQPAGPTPAELLAKMPRRPMSPEQQAAALEKVQQQATQRIKLGQQLFEAADARLKQHQQVLHDIQEQQQKLREQVQEDVAKSLQAYDQWMGQIDESFTNAIKELGQRIDVLETRFDCSRNDMERMIDKAAALLEQTQGLLADAFGDEALGEAAAKPVLNASSPVEHDLVDTFAQAHMTMDADDEESDHAEVIEVEIVDQHGESADDEPATMYDAIPLDTDRTREADDVFGEVLRRLRSQADDDHDAAA